MTSRSSTYGSNSADREVICRRSGLNKSVEDDHTGMDPKLVLESENDNGENAEEPEVANVERGEPDDGNEEEQEEEDGDAAEPEERNRVEEVESVGFDAAHITDESDTGEVEPEAENRNNEDEDTQEEEGNEQDENTAAT